MSGLIAKALASLSLALRQPIQSFCDLDTADGPALISRRGEYVTFVRILGLRRMTLREDVERIAEGLRIDLSGSLEGPGHAIQGWYACDPDLAGTEIRRLATGARQTALQLGMDLSFIFAERERLWPRIMRWEACCFVLWSKRSLLTREERKQAAEERKKAAKGAPAFGDAQNPFQSSDILAAKHSAFVQRVAGTFRDHEIAVEVLGPTEALAAARAAIYPETADSGWQPLLPGDNVMPRLPVDGEQGDAGLLLWPSLRDQLFHADAETHGGQRARIGTYDWSSIDMSVGPEDARPFAELVGRLAGDRIPWRMSLLVEGGGQSMMAVKQLIATILGWIPANKQIFEAFSALRRLKEENLDIHVKLRASFATWVAAGEIGRLRRSTSTLAQRVGSWGNCRVGTIAGDPLEGVMSSALGLAIGSTAPPAAAPLGEVLRMLPWGRPGSPWHSGSVLFRTPDGRIWPFDPAGSRRARVLDLFVAPSRFGKSVLDNTILLGLCLSNAAQGTNGTKLPLIGKLDMGPSAKGLVLLLQAALPLHRRDEAVYVAMQLDDAHAYNIFDTQLGCRTPLPLERAFLQNFLSLGTMPIDAEIPFEGMDQMVGFVIDEAYRMVTDSGPNIRPKRYQRGIEPEVDDTLARHGIELEAEPWWWDVVDALFCADEPVLAGIAQRHAMPLLQDLITAARSPQVRDMFTDVEAETREKLPQLFERYIKALIRKYPTLNRPTRLVFGQARVIVLDLDAVAPKGSAEADRQTDLMYMLGRHILARNFFLHPEYLAFVPELVRGHHAKRFTEIYEAYKRLAYDEYHRTAGRRFVREQVELDGREGAKHNIQLGLSSQRMADFGEYLISQSTGRFVLGAGDEKEAEEIIARFNVTAASAEVIRHRLKGPDQNGGGAPFLAILEVDNVKYEQMLVNSLGPVELWALSTTPEDVALRGRLYQRLGHAEALRRLSRVFPKGTARRETERRKDERTRRGEDEGHAMAGVVQELADELINGQGLGIVLRRLEAEEDELEAV